eukprot:472839-Pyramimonas_sp.AAC.1
MRALTFPPASAVGMLSSLIQRGPEKQGSHSKSTWIALRLATCPTASPARCRTAASGSTSTRSLGGAAPTLQACGP